MINFNTLLAGYLGLFLFSTVAQVAVDFTQSAHLKRHAKEVPPELDGLIDSQKLILTCQYSIEKLWLDLIGGLIGKAVLLYLILSGLLPWVAEYVAHLPFVVQGLLFFSIPSIAGASIALPFGYYHAFVLEQKYGFNTTTFRTWLMDLLKSGALSIVLGGTLLSCLLVMVKYTGNAWWIWAWAIFFSFEVLMSLLYPTLFAPMFNKFTPISPGPLAEKISRLAEREGLMIKGVYEMDAKRRSRHTNAYVAGMGKTKRIVLFDTLLASHDEDEILAILAHEIGHIKRGHLKKQVILHAISSLMFLYFASRLISWRVMYESFGFDYSPLYAGLFLAAVVWEPLSFFLYPIASGISRRFELAADLHVLRALGSPKPFIRALKKMAMDNLSNLHPHPLYVFFHYSHPPFLERIAILKEKAGGGEL
jgi:STE24 endopeptidase